MYLDKEDRNNPVRSEGKLLEITPCIDLNNQPFMLPPITYKCPNWLLGFSDWHSIGLPRQITFNAVAAIDGTNIANWVQLKFMVRLLEDSPGMIPDSVPTVVPEELKALIIERLKTEC